MDTKTIAMIVLAIALYVLASGTGNAATTTTQVGQGCLQSIQAQYGSQWAEMNQVQRAMVGLRASACEEGR